VMDLMNASRGYSAVGDSLRFPGPHICQRCCQPAAMIDQRGAGGVIILYGTCSGASARHDRSLLLLSLRCSPKQSGQGKHSYQKIFDAQRILPALFTLSDTFLCCSCRDVCFLMMCA
jgi:hypothetical protein